MKLDQSVLAVWLWVAVTFLLAISTLSTHAQAASNGTKTVSASISMAAPIATHLSTVDYLAPTSDAPVVVHVFGTTAKTSVHIALQSASDSLSLTIITSQAYSDNNAQQCSSGLPSVGTAATATGVSSVLSLSGSLGLPTGSLTFNKVYKLCTSKGEDPRMLLYYGPAVTSASMTSALGSAAALPFSVANWNAWNTPAYALAADSTSAVTLSQMANMMTAFSQETSFYLVDGGAATGCARAAPLHFLSLDSSFSFQLSRDALSAAVNASSAPTTISSIQLCFLGSDVINLKIDLIDSLKVNNEAINSFGLLDISATMSSSLVLSFEFTLRAAVASSFSAGTLYVCDPSTLGAASSRGTLTAGQSSTSGTKATQEATVIPQTTANALGICWNLYTSAVRLSLGVQVSAFTVSAIDGVPTSDNIVHILRPVISQPTWSIATTGAGTIQGSTLFASVTSACSANAFSSTVVVPSTNTVTIPTDWYATPSTTDWFLCGQSTTGNAKFLLGAFKLRVAQIDSIVRTNDTETSFVTLLAGETTTLKVTGTVSDATRLSLYWYDGAACGSLISVLSSTGEASVRANDVPTTASSVGFCIKSSAASGVARLGAVVKVGITSFGLNGLMSMYSQGTAAVAFPVAVNTTTTSILSGLSFALCSGSNTDIIIGGFQAPSYNSLNIIATSAAVGSHQVCWRYRAYTAISAFTLHVLPTPSSTQNVFGGIALVRTGAQYKLNFDGQFSSALSSAHTAAVKLTTGTCSPSMSGVASFTLSLPTSGQSMSLTFADAYIAGRYNLCGGLLPNGATSSADTVYPFTLGTMNFTSISVGSVVIPPSPVKVLSVDGTDTTGSQSWKFASTFALDASVVIDFAISTNSDCSSVAVISNSNGVLTTDTTVTFDIAQVAKASATTLQPVVCALIRNTGNKYFDTSLRLALVELASIDSQALVVSSNTSASKIVLSVLSGTTREVSVVGKNLNVPSSWSALLFTGAGASCSSSPNAVITLQVQSSTSAKITIPAVTAGNYQTVCLAFVGANTGITTYVNTNAMLVVSPIVAFARKRTDAVQQTSIVATKDVSKSVLLQMEAVATSYSLPLTTALHAVTSNTACNAVQSFDSSNLLPVFLSNNELYLHVNASRFTTAGVYKVCIKTTVAGTSYGASTGVQMTIVDVKLAGNALGSGKVIGASVNHALDLRVTGSFLTAAYMYVAATDLSCTAGLTGNTAYGNSRALTQITGCGSSFASATIPAATVNTTTNMNLCLAIAPAADPQPTISDLTAFDTGVFLAVTEPTELVLLTNLSSTTTDETGTLAEQPVLGLLDQSTGAILGNVPVGLLIKASWVAVSPIEQEIDESYDLVTKSGDTTIDFSQTPIQLKNGKFGFQYILKFVAVGSVYKGTNSSTVELGACASSAQLAEIFTRSCVECPATANCNGSIHMRVSGSYWRPHDQSLKFYSCMSPYMDHSCTENTPTGTCRPGHAGARCSVCEDGFANSFDVCVDCGSNELNIFLVVLALIVILFIVILLVFSTLQCKKSDQFPIYIKLFINHLTVTSTMEFSRNLPNALLQLFKIQRQVSRPSPAFAAFDCATGASWYAKFITVNAIPIGCAFVVAVLLLFKQTLQQQKNRRLSKVHPAALGDSALDDSSVVPRTATVAFKTPGEQRDAGDKNRYSTDRSNPNTPIGEDESAVDATAKTLDVPPLDLQGTGNNWGDLTVSVDLNRTVDVSNIEADAGEHGDANHPNMNPLTDEYPERPVSAPSGEEQSRPGTANSEGRRRKSSTNPGLMSDDEEDGDLAQTASKIALSRKETENLGYLQVSGVVAMQQRRHIFAVTMIIILFFTYPSIVEWCANVLKCDEIDHSILQADGTVISDVRQYFYYDRSKLCSDDEHGRYVLAGLVLGLVYGFGTPIASILLVRHLRRPKKLGGIGNRAASRMFTFLIAGYRKETWWWEGPMMIKKLALIYIWAFVTNSRLQTILAFWVTAAHLAMHSYMNPYEYEIADEMERASLIVMCVTLNLSFLFEWVAIDSTSKEFQTYAYLLLIFVLILNIGIVLWMLWRIILEGSIKFRKFLRDDEKWIRETFPQNCPRCFIEWLLKYKYPTPTVLAIDEDGVAIEIGEDDLTPEERHAVQEQDSASDWSSDDDFTIDGDGNDSDDDLNGSPVNDDGSVDPNAMTSRNGATVGDLSKTLAELNGTTGGGEIQFASNDPAVLKSIARSLKRENDEAKARLADATEKSRQNERVMEVFKKQLRISETYATQVEDDLQAQIDDMETAQKALRDLEEEVEILKGRFNPSKQLMREMRAERDELRKKLAKQQQEGAGSYANMNESKPSPRLERHASSAMFERIGTYRRRVEDIQKNKNAKIRQIHQEASLQQSLRAAIIDVDREQQQKLIQEKIEEKRRVKLEKSLNFSHPEGSEAQKAAEAVRREQEEQHEDESAEPTNIPNARDIRVMSASEGVASDQQSQLDQEGIAAGLDATHGSLAGTTTSHMGGIKAASRLILLRNRVEKRKDHPKYKGAWKSLNVEL